MNFLKSKKGIMFSSITRAVLSLLVIVIIAGIPLYQYTNEKLFEGKGIVNYVKNYWKEKENFTPWQPPEVVGEDKRVLDSINALRCGLNSVTAGVVKSELCKGITQREDKFYFGDKEVSCEMGVGETINLANDKDLVKLAMIISNCQKQKRYRLCATINSNINIEVSRIKEKIRELTGEPVEYLTYDFETTPVRKTFYVIKDTRRKWYLLSSKNEVLLTENLESNYDYFVREGVATPNTCYVKNFELPQKVENTKEWARSWITNANDPKYLLYHEMFPIGEDKAWQIDKWGFISDAVIYGGLVNGLMAGLFGGFSKMKELPNFLRKIFTTSVEEKSFQLVIKNLGKDIAKKLSKEEVAVLGELFTKEGQERIIKTQLLMKQLIEKGVSEELAEKVSEEALLKLGIYKLSKVENLVKKFLEEDVDEIIKSLVKGVSEERAEALKRVIRESMEDVFTKKLTKKTMQELNDLASIKQFINKNLAKEGGIGRNAVKNFIEKALENTKREVMEELGEKVEIRLVERSLDYFHYLSGEEGMIKLLGKKMFQSLKDKIDKLAKKFTLEKKELLSRLITGKSNEELKKILKKTATKEGLKELVKQSPIQLRWWKIKYNPMSASIKIPVSLLWSALASVEQTTKLTGKALYTAWENKIIKYALLYQIAESIARIDAKNNKYKSRGNNNLVLNIPYSFESVSVYPLGDDIKKYPVNLKKENGYTRFFSASPCKSNIEITKQICSCEVNNKDFVWEEGDEKVPLFGPSVELKSENLEMYNSFEEATELAKLNKTTDCVTESFYGEECRKEIIKNPEIFDEFVKFLYYDFYIPLLKSGSRSTSDVAPFLREKINEYSSTTDNIGFEVKEPIGEKWDFRVFFENILVTKESYGSAVKKRIHDISMIGSTEIYFSLKFDVERMELEEFKKKMKVNAEKYDLLRNSGYFGYGDDPNALLLIFIMIERNKLNHDLRTNSLVFSERAKNSFLYKAAKRASFSYYKVKEKDIDLTKTVKNCIITSESETTEDLLLTEENKARVATPCLIVEHRNIENYCFSSEHESLKKWGNVFSWSVIALDIGISVFFPPLTVPAAIILGASEGAIDQMIEDKAYWPNH